MNKSIKTLSAIVIGVLFLQGCSCKKDSNTIYKNTIYKQAVVKLVKERNKTFEVDKEIINYNKGQE